MCVPIAKYLWIRRPLTPLVVDVRFRAIEVLLAITAGAYQTTLLTYMIQRDLFPSVMRVRLPLLAANYLRVSKLTPCSSSKTPTRRSKSSNRLRYSDSWQTTTSSSFRTRTRCG